MDESSANRLNQKLSAVISELESDQSILKQNIAVEINELVSVGVDLDARLNYVLEEVKRVDQENFLITTQIQELAGNLHKKAQLETEVAKLQTALQGEA